MLSIIRSKACKRCQGDLSLESDVYGTYVQCLQCGATYSEEEFREHIEQAKSQAIHARPAARHQVSR